MVALVRAAMDPLDGHQHAVAAALAPSVLLHTAREYNAGRISSSGAIKTARAELLRALAERR